MSYLTQRVSDARHRHTKWKNNHKSLIFLKHGKIEDVTKIRANTMFHMRIRMWNNGEAIVISIVLSAMLGIVLSWYKMAVVSTWYFFNHKIIEWK